VEAAMRHPQPPQALAAYPPPSRSDSDRHPNRLFAMKRGEVPLTMP
jgi:hypothetical protein